MRKGFSLIELLFEMAVLAFASVIFAGLFTTVITDIPRSFRVIQTNTTVFDMLRQMRRDIDSANELPVSFEQYVTNDKMLLIELADCIISYQIDGDRIIRRRMSVAQQSGSDDIRVWLVPHANIQWQVWRKESNGFAVEVKTHIEHKVRGHLEKNMGISNLFYANALQRSLK